MSKVFKPAAASGAPVDRTIAVLTYLEKMAKALREKVEKEQSAPPWLLERAHKAALELSLTAPYLSVPSESPKNKKFEPSIKPTKTKE